MRAVQITRFGGPEVLELADVADPEPAQDQVLIRVARSGMNFADTHTRENSYLARQSLPLIPGAEVGGTVQRDAGALSAGTRVVAMLPSGGYAEARRGAAGDDLPDPRRTRRGRRARAADPGSDRLAPSAHLGQARRGRGRRRALRRGRRRQPRRPARPGVRRRARDRHRLVGPATRAGARAGSRRCSRCRG